ncbi:single-stranded-DNA-specific exonuclease RecJ [Macrococcus carouselicus]|uniref:Single-stranded-DNA-specific exonuclease RecJ n=1 Tax=Macrococcus carouselicus TaxID=69969 RepID=A0A9Q8CLU2_9STAP|nr:single-stranded-DNA-specific exonuclease RecJ [Macrococcus carouselicus]TDM04436.1 single-stranded-DNA-specific exonuclease RecJ [Macrococcus carouselicus]
MAKQWLLKQQEKELDEALIKEFKVSPLLKEVLEARGITERDHLEKWFKESALFDPFLMFNMDIAVQRIQEAVENMEPIIVYGDYDADGVTSVTILMAALEEIGAMADFYIPNRFTEGYGPNEAAFRSFADDGVGLIITVDNGVKGHHEVEVAKSLGMDVIITDHHEIGDILPDAYAVLHPAHPEGDYPCPHLAGAGVSLKLATALMGRAEPELIGMAAIGTVSDLVPLTGENRWLVKKGLDALNQALPVGVRALLAVAGHQGDVTEETIGFMIGPRLNAVGRLEDARPAAELLMEQDSDYAAELAQHVDAYNIERKSVVETITEEAMVQAADKVAQGMNFLVISGHNWNEGVLGIVASKIVERFYRPTIVLNLTADYAKGSARSIVQVSMYDYLETETELLTKFGGHHMAAGLTMPQSNVELLEQRLNDRIEEQEELQPVIEVDAEVDFADVTADFIRQLDQLRPFGTGNPQPVFKLSNVKITQNKAIGQQGAHMKMTLNDSLTALKWSAGGWVHDFPAETVVDVCGKFQLNEWNGHVTPQMLLEDVKTDDIRYIDYRNQHANRFAFLKNEDVIYLINSDRPKQSGAYFFYGDNISGHDKIVLRDLPVDMTAFFETMKSATAKQIYIIFYEPAQVYFDGMPSLDKFRQLYKIIIRQPINLVNQGMSICQTLGVTPDTLIFMMEVLKERQLVFEADGLYNVYKEAGKVEMLASPVYLERHAQLEREQQLLYSSFDSVKKLINEKMF